MQENIEKSDTTYPPIVPNLPSLTDFRMRNEFFNNDTTNLWNPYISCFPHLIHPSQLLQLMNFPPGSLLPSPNSKPQNFSNPISKPIEHISSLSPSSSQVNNEERKVESNIEATCGSSKDPKRNRTSFLTQQSEILEKAFQSERYITKTQRVQLAQQLDLPENTIKANLFLFLIHYLFRCGSKIEG
ncbi:unnamed protein product [Hymenolepis diminuta]|uniref:Homeobox domain-containing protein n=1 Tax=Hymenolepis diminuta TaxID=6216 RepID=A0A564ZB95_HYMDI|nr:unnamed protein product [Hymenolepis diminuta]